MGPKALIANEPSDILESDVAPALSDHSELPPGNGPRNVALTPSLTCQKIFTSVLGTIIVALEWSVVRVTSGVQSSVSDFSTSFPSTRLSWASTVYS